MNHLKLIQPDARTEAAQASLGFDLADLDNMLGRGAFDVIHYNDTDGSHIVKPHDHDNVLVRAHVSGGENLTRLTDWHRRELDLLADHNIGLPLHYKVKAERIDPKAGELLYGDAIPTSNVLLTVVENVPTIVLDPKTHATILCALGHSLLQYYTDDKRPPGDPPIGDIARFDQYTLDPLYQRALLLDLGPQKTIYLDAQLSRLWKEASAIEGEEGEKLVARTAAIRNQASTLR